MNMGVYDEAIGVCRRALDLLAGSDVTFAWDQTDCQETISQCYAQLGQGAEAKKWEKGAVRSRREAVAELLPSLYKTRRSRPW